METEAPVMLLGVGLLLILATTVAYWFGVQIERRRKDEILNDLRTQLDQRAGYVSQSRWWQDDQYLGDTKARLQ